MRRGVQLYTVREYLETPKQVEEPLRKINAIGYDSVPGRARGGLPANEVLQFTGAIALVTSS